MCDLLDVAFIVISWVLPVVDRMHQGCVAVTDCFENVSQKAISKAQAVVAFAAGLPKAFQDKVASCLGYFRTERVWVCGSNLLSRLFQWSAVLCLSAIVALVFCPAACACVLTAVVLAYWEMGWVFWLLLLDLISIAVVCTSWCRWCFHTLSDAPGRICSATSNSLEETVSTFQRLVKSCFSKLTAYVEHTTLTALRKLKALVWRLLVYPFVLLAMSVSFCVGKCIKWLVPSCCIRALRRGRHVIYLFCTGSFFAAFKFAVGFGALSDSQAPSKSILFIQHTCLASMLRFWLPEGVFNTLDGFATSFELLCYGKKACKQYKKRLRRHAMKAQRTRVSSGFAGDQRHQAADPTPAQGPPLSPHGLAAPGPSKQASGPSSDKADALLAEKAPPEKASLSPLDNPDSSPAKQASGFPSDKTERPSSEKASATCPLESADAAPHGQSGDSPSHPPTSKPARSTPSMEPSSSQSENSATSSACKSDATADVEPQTMSNNKVRSQVKADALGGGEGDDDSWSLPAHHTHSSSLDSSTDITSTDENSAASDGAQLMGGAAVDESDLQPANTEPEMAAGESPLLPAREAVGSNHSLQPAKEEDGAAAATHPKQFNKQDNEAAAGDLPQQPTQEAAAAADESPLQKLPGSTIAPSSAGSSGAVRGTKHSTHAAATSAANDTGKSGSLSEVAQAADESSVPNTVESKQQVVRILTKPRRPPVSLDNTGAPATLPRAPWGRSGLGTPPADGSKHSPVTAHQPSVPFVSLNAARLSSAFQPSAERLHTSLPLHSSSAGGVSQRRTLEYTRPTEGEKAADRSSASEAPGCGPLQRPTRQNESRGLKTGTFRHAPPRERYTGLWQPYTPHAQYLPPHTQPRAVSSAPLPTSVLPWGRSGLSTPPVDGSHMVKVTTAPISTGPAARRALNLPHSTSSHQARLSSSFLPAVERLHTSLPLHSSSAGGVSQRRTLEYTRPTEVEKAADGSPASEAPGCGPAQRPTRRNESRGLKTGGFRHAPPWEQYAGSWQLHRAHACYSPSDLQPRPVSSAPSPTSVLHWGTSGLDTRPADGSHMAKVTTAPFTNGPAARRALNLPHSTSSHQGVADGVGGWGKEGVCPGEFARQLMATAERESSFLAICSTAPAYLMRRAHNGVQGMKGSCTACILVLEGNQLHVANLGDSGFLVVRNGKVVYKSEPQQVSFNYPYQLHMPGATRGQLPCHADIRSVELLAGDSVVVGTDGLFDNVFDWETAAAVTMFKRAGDSSQLVAEQLAKLARLNATLTEGESPFAVGAMEAGRPRPGGKMDDISVIVAHVQEAAAFPPTAPVVPSWDVGLAW